MKSVAHTPRIAIIGLGCGITLAAALESAQQDLSVETIEINPVIPKATELFMPLLDASSTDARHQLIIDDGFRHFARREGALYDAVILDVAWMQNMNATHLFSKEMFQNVKRKMGPEGLFVVWSEEFNPFSPVSQIIFRTMQAVFPIVRVEQADDAATVFYATTAPMASRLDAMLKPETVHLTRWLSQASSTAPLNTLDDLAMNRSKFTWFGDSSFDRLFERYKTPD